MLETHFILATAGHVDHGKSTLVKALTGTDPDRLPEEKARKITIELGFAHLQLPAPPSIIPPSPSATARPRRNELEAGNPHLSAGAVAKVESSTFSVGIVDVPGHEDFVRNMIAGIGSVDLALLAVAADDGWMPQTEEHLQILIYLGVKRAVIALTKSDMGKIDGVVAQIRAQLRDTPFATSQIIPTSVRSGEGVENLKRALASECAMLPSPNDAGKPRLFIDRAFTLRGIGTVVTGTLTGGKLRRGQNVLVQPRNFPARVRSIQSHGRDLEVARPGMRTAINLPEVAIGTSSAAIKRGDLITVADLGLASSILDAVLEKSPRLKPNTPAARPLKNGSSVHIHHGTTRVAAKVTLLEAPALECGERICARLRLESPILALLGDRFVIRDSSEQHTIAGGIVLDPDGNEQNFRSSAQIQFLTTRATTPDDVAGSAFGGQLLQRGSDRSQLNATRRSSPRPAVGPTSCLSGTKWIDRCLQSELARCGFAQSRLLLRKSNFSEDEIAAGLLRLQSRRSIVLRGEIAADAEKWRALLEHASTLIDDAHKKNPEQRGLELVELRAALHHPSTDVFEAVVLDLCRNGFARSGTALARVAYRATLPPRIQPAAEKIRSALAVKCFDPPTRKAIAQDRPLQQALRFLIEQGEVIEIASDVVLSREGFSQMKDAVIAFISKNQSATVSQLRQELQTSRRVIVPLLERLDRDGVTRRVGDKRTLGSLQ